MSGILPNYSRKYEDWRSKMGQSGPTRAPHGQASQVTPCPPRVVVWRPSAPLLMPFGHKIHDLEKKSYKILRTFHRRLQGGTGAEHFGLWKTMGEGLGWGTKIPILARVLGKMIFTLLPPSIRMRGRWKLSMLGSTTKANFLGWGA